MQPPGVQASSVPRVDILGVGVSAISLDSAVAQIVQWIKTRHQTYVCITGAHGIIESRRDPELRRIHNSAGLVTPDGMPLVFMARQLGYSWVTRVYGPDLMLQLSALSAQSGYRQFYFGGGPEVADELAQKLTDRNAGLVVAGTLTPPFHTPTKKEDDAIVAAINRAAPDVLWIGLSTPKQEQWMASHLGRITAPVMIGVGAAFDFLAERKRQAPAWMQRNGLEWLFRLSCEPRRLWRRYLTVVPTFMTLAAFQLVARRIRKETMDAESLHYQKTSEYPCKH